MKAIGRFWKRVRVKPILAEASVKDSSENCTVRFG